MNILLGDVGEECHTNIGRTQQRFGTIDFESTQMHARLNYRYDPAVDLYFFQLGRECVLLFFLYYFSVLALRNSYTK